MPAAFVRTTRTTARRRRRGIVAAAIFAVGALALSACSSDGNAAVSTAAGSSSAAALSGQVVWADYGGPTNKARYTSYFDDFTASTGVSVTSEVINDATMNTMLTGGEGEYDAMHVGLDSVYKYQDNLQQLPAGTTLDDAIPSDINQYAFGTFIVGHAQGYLTSTFPNGGPKTWADFFDTKKFPGKRAWPGSPGSYDSTCEVALLADGVAPADLYPLDLARCDKKMDTIKDDMVFYTSYPEIQTLLASGTAAIAMGPSGQFAALRNSGQDVTVSWDQAIASPNTITIPKTAPDKANIFALAQAMSDPKAQAAFAKLTNYGPGNTKAFDYMDQTTKDNVVNSPSHTNIVFQNSKARAAQTDELLANYTKWLGQ
ncbi:extracellular solute-binding protein [Subtercola endophyticus]|uniref:extracellular solute-binding protein n=1 Tax=Subtercola endophyticus TaxID=2895559 RepID=UPI001E4A6725|nr:extracellular solute-binding protein [Subtercola endophyticus]UFS58682.1 extracellular solute-binding protein [Subtercola endophyticus]